MGLMTNEDDQNRRFAALLFSVSEKDVSEDQLIVARALGNGFTYQIAKACKGNYFNKAEASIVEYECVDVQSLHYYRTQPSDDNSNATTFLYIAVVFKDLQEVHLTTPSSFKNNYIGKRITTPNKCFIHDTVADVKSSCEKLGFWL